MNRWIHEQAAPGGESPAEDPVPAKAAPPSPAEVEDARARRTYIKLAIALGLMGLVAVALPLFIAQSRQAGPMREVRAEGFHMRYIAPLYGKKLAVDYYIGTGSDGRCLVANRLAWWDTGLCEIRLRQIRAGDCNAVPGYNDEHCRAMPLGAAPARETAGAQAHAGMEPGVEAERRAVRILFLVREGETTTASELP
jgi:hypothetical protein